MPRTTAISRSRTRLTYRRSASVARRFAFVTTPRRLGFNARMRNAALLATASNALGLDLWSRVRSMPGNLAISSASLSIALEMDSASTFHDLMARLGGQADHCTQVIAPVSDVRTPRTTTPPLIQVVHTGSRIRRRCSAWPCAEPLPARSPIGSLIYRAWSRLVMPINTDAS